MCRVLLGSGGRPVSADKWEMGGHRARGGPGGGGGAGQGGLRTLEKPSHPRVTLSSPAGAFEGSEKQERAWTADSPRVLKSSRRAQGGGGRECAAEAGCPSPQVRVWKACRSIYPALWEELDFVCSSIDGDSGSNSVPQTLGSLWCPRRNIPPLLHVTSYTEGWRGDVLNNISFLLY